MPRKFTFLNFSGSRKKKKRFPVELFSREFHTADLKQVMYTLTTHC